MTSKKPKESSEIVPEVVKSSIEETIRLGTKGFKEVQKAAKKGYKQGKNNK